jgi:hypothetical protein
LRLDGRVNQDCGLAQTRMGALICALKAEVK